MKPTPDQTPNQSLPASDQSAAGIAGRASGGQLTRREALLSTASLATGALLIGALRPSAAAASPAAGALAGEALIAGAQPVVGPAGPAAGPALPPGRPGLDYTPVVTPNGRALPWKLVDGVKVFHLIAEPVRHEFAPGLVADCWGYNGSVHGPTIEAVEGDRLRLYVTNRLSAPTTVHWHGIFLPAGMDGVGGLNQRAIPPGETFRYEFTLRQHGTFMYHSHHDEMTQMALGLMGMIVVHPRQPVGPPVQRDYVYMLSEWKLAPGTTRPDPNEMTDFNVLSLNARIFPGTQPLLAQLGERVRIRIGNLSAMDHHPIHLHGYAFKITATDGGTIPESARWPETTVLVPTGSTRTVEFVADAPGDWAMHCHMTHHVMNQMGHGIPNTIGIVPGDLDERVRKLLPGYMTMGQHGMGDMAEMGMAVPTNSLPMVGGTGPFGTITMGGMFTLLKVRERLVGTEDPGWYENPPGTVAETAAASELARDGIDAAAPSPTESHSGHTHGAEPAPAHAQPPAPAPAPAPTPPPAPAPAQPAYLCPMHPTITSEGPARCSLCGMKLVPRK
ncbi:MAG: multicopper oxidase domain-containing protein [Planctomycetota bacterium]